MACTIHDIARTAGVSAKTVSRVINDQAGVGEATRARIGRIIDEQGYHPHTGARNMRGHTRDCIGLTLSAPPDQIPLSEPLLVWLFAELYRVFGRDGYYLCFDINPFKRGPGSDYARGLWEQRFAGCVVCGPLRIGDKIIHRIHESGHPYVALGRLDSLPECHCATVDYEEGSRLSAGHLLSTGHKRVAMLKGLDGYQPGEERRRGYMKACEEAGVEADASLIHRVSFASRDIVNTVHRALLDSSVTGLVDASGAEDAASIREGARRAGRVPGKDFEIVVWTYTHNATILSEASAHMWLPVREATTEGLELLGECFRGERTGPIRVVYRPTLYNAPANGEMPKPKPVFEVLS